MEEAEASSVELASSESFIVTLGQQLLRLSLQKMGCVKNSIRCLCTQQLQLQHKPACS